MHDLFHFWFYLFAYLLSFTSDLVHSPALEDYKLPFCIRQVPQNQFMPPPLSSPTVLLREEVAQLQEEVHLLRQMKDMLSKDLEETQGGCSANLLSATELRVQLSDKEQELDRAREALQGQRSM